VDRREHGRNGGGSKARSRDSFYPSKLSDWIDVTAKIGAILAGIFAVYQYLETQKSERIKATLEYVKRFNAPDENVSKSVRKLSHALNANRGNILRYQNATLTSEQSDAVRKRLADQIVEQAGSENDVVQDIDDFFDNLRICVQSRICDEKTATEFFHGYVSNFLENFGSVVQDRSNMSPGFGRGTSWISKAGQKK
jgi:hypothetical protein